MGITNISFILDFYLNFYPLEVIHHPLVLLSWVFDTLLQVIRGYWQPSEKLFRFSKVAKASEEFI
jgi:hypothetical protein